MDRMPGIDPFAEEDESILQPLLDDGTLHCRPLLEQVVLRVHSLGDEMSPALEDHLPSRREVNADVRAVDLLFDDQRLIGNELDWTPLR